MESACLFVGTNKTEKSAEFRPHGVGQNVQLRDLLPDLRPLPSEQIRFRDPHYASLPSLVPT